VIVEVLVSKRESVGPLSEQRLNAELDRFRVPVVNETLGELPNDPSPRIKFREQQHPSIGADRPTVELRHDFALSDALKLE